MKVANPPKLLVFVIASATILMYLPALHFPFIWDDLGQIARNGLLRDMGNLYELVTSSTFFSNGQLYGAFYRPIASLSFLANYQVWGLQTFGFRLFQLAFHVVNVFLVFKVVELLTAKFCSERSKFLPPAIALLFAFHPVHVESVIYTSAISEPLMAFFGLLSLALLLTTTPTGKLNILHYVTYGILILLSLFSKESGMAFILIALALMLMSGSKREFVYTLAASIASSLVYLLVRLGIANVPFVFNFGSTISDISIFQRLLTAPYIIAHDLTTLTYPATLAIYNNTVISSALDFRFWGFGILIGLFALLSFYLIRRPYKELALFFAAWFLISLVPVLNILSLEMTTADRWLYVPSIGLVGYLVTVIACLWSRDEKILARGFVAIILTIAFAFAGRTIVRELDWRSPLSLYGHDIQIVGTSAELATNYAISLMENGRPNEALEFIHRSIALKPTYIVSQTNLAVIYQALGRTDEAIDQNLHVIDTYDQEFIHIAYQNLAAIYIKAGNFDEAQRVLNGGQLLFPLNTRLRFLQATLLLNSGAREEGIEIIDQLLKENVPRYDIRELEALLAS